MRGATLGSDDLKEQKLRDERHSVDELDSKRMRPVTEKLMSMTTNRMNRGGDQIACGRPCDLLNNLEFRQIGYYLIAAWPCGRAVPSTPALLSACEICNRPCDTAKDTRRYVIFHSFGAVDRISGVCLRKLHTRS